ncbi:ABC transporter transmembrane domain-containing protein [Paenibacillus sp. UNC451MF]|uniref:ABC transporter transmembrane domain-containing protein n=1 Tax=Paenibacillus sp. UNC451MF TaxID=1449063 RepID=UPI00048BD4A4|nr:ABC transporter transmembrane domain-containing protein [Paenibacillus sp. UNC451MF]
MNLITALLGYFARYKLLCGLFVSSIFIEVAYAVAAPLSLKYLVDEAFTPKNFQVFLSILSILIGGGLFNIGASLCGDYSLGRLSGEVIRRLRMDLFSHLQQQSLPFYQRYRVGDLVTRFASDMVSIERVIRAAMPLFLRETLSILLGLIMLFSLEWKLTLAVLAGSVLMFVGPRMLQERAETVNISSKEAQERFSNSIDEMVKGHKTIKGLHLQQRFKEQAKKQIHELFTLGLRLHITNAIMERLPLTTLLILNGIMIGFGGYLIFHDEMTVGGFMAFFTLFMSVGQSGSNMAYLIPNLIESKISFQRIGEIFNERTDVPESEKPVELLTTLPSIRMDQVSFGYNDETLQLRDINLHIEAGTYVAFVGGSGSGKSTALQLLSRYYDPKQGTITINGYDIRTVSQASLRNLSTLVSQDTFLFHTTVRDNLILDRTDTSDAEMMEAAKQAKIHDVIANWPEGYDTWIHHEGGSLSGGERQRMAIARALLRKPKLLLMDEVTSALDPATESDINQLIQQIRGEKTIVSVTHRLASVVNADQIYVFQEGRIVESGKHQELLQLHGVYNSMWEKQHGFHLSQDGLHATVDVQRLSKLPFFEGIEAELLQNIAALFATETCSEGETIIRQGEEGNKCYIIVRGSVEILKHFDGDGEKRVAVLQDGDHFGEIALLTNSPRNATVRSIGPTVLLSVRREEFHQLTAIHPQIVRTLEQTLQKRI